MLRHVLQDVVHLLHIQSVSPAFPQRVENSDFNGERQMPAYEIEGKNLSLRLGV